MRIESAELISLQNTIKMKCIKNNYIIIIIISDNLWFITVAPDDGRHTVTLIKMADTLSHL